MEQLKENLISSEPDTEKMEKEHKLVVVTGFGPFAGHEEKNASWEAVKLLPNQIIYKDIIYKLEKKEIEVEYEAVDKAVTEIWQRKPELVIHCGVHGNASCVHVEKLAYNHKFSRPDYKGKRLSNASACLVNCGEGIKNDVIRCGLNVDKIVASIGELGCECTPVPKATIASNNVENNTAQKAAKVSHDVGNYLCGYIYLKSLDMNEKRSLFIHVPPIIEPFSSEQTSRIVLQIIEECIRQVAEQNNTC